MLYFISDYLSSEIRRGAELANSSLLFYLPAEVIESKNLVSIDKDSFYIISNFVQLSESTKSKLIEYKNYLIYEHDHKYTISRNPFRLYTNRGYIDNPTGVIPPPSLINIEFYKQAKAVICQTKWHEEQLRKNLSCNLTNIGGSFYLPEDLDLLQELSKQVNRKNKYLIFNDSETIVLKDGSLYNQGKNIKNKQGAIEYCLDKRLPYVLLPRIDDKQRFWETMASYTSFVFLPDIPESCSRLLIEAKMLNLNVVTNEFSGACHEPWWSLKGESLITYFRDKLIPEGIKLIQGYL